MRGVDAMRLKSLMKDTIIATLRREGGQGSLKVLISSLMIETGFSKKTVTEYMEAMEDTGLVEIEGNRVKLPKKTKGGK